jgi:hypothetical protein
MHNEAVPSANLLTHCLQHNPGCCHTAHQC